MTTPAIRQPAEIFNWLMRNSKYYVINHSQKEIRQMLLEPDRITLYVSLNYVPPFHADYDEFVKFLKEPYSFDYHIAPLVQQELISVCGNPPSALVKDYKINKTYVRFWLGKDPNK